MKLPYEITIKRPNIEIVVKTATPEDAAKAQNTAQMWLEAAGNQEENLVTLVRTIMDARAV